jgi:hypothetical protein
VLVLTLGSASGGHGDLTVGGIILQAGSAGNAGGGKITCDANATSTGTLTVTGAGTVSVTGSSVASNTGAETIDFSTGGCNFITGTGTATFTGGTTGATPDAALKMGTGKLTLNGNLTFATNSTKTAFTTAANSTIEFNANSNVSIAGATMTVTIASPTNITNTAGSSTWSTTTAISIVNWGTCTVTAGTLTFAAAQTCVTVNVNGGTLAMGANILTVSGNLTIANGAALTSTVNTAVTGNYTNNGTHSGASGSLTVSGASSIVSGTGNTSITGTIQITGLTGPTIGVNSNLTLNNLTLAAAVPLTLTNGSSSVCGTSKTCLTVTNALTIAALTGAANKTVISLGGANTSLTVSGTTAFNMPGVAFTATIAVGAGSATFTGKLTETGSTASAIASITLTSGTITFGAGIDTSGTTNATAADHILDISGGAGTVSFTGTVQTNAAANTATGWTFTNTTCTGGGGTFNYTGSGAQTVVLPTGGYCNLKITNTNASGATLAGNLSATNQKGNLTVGDGAVSAIFNEGGFAIVGNAGSTVFQVTNAATFNMTAGGTYPTAYATFTYGASSTVNYGQTTNNLNITNATYGNLILGPTATATFILPATISGIAGNLTIGNGSNTGTIQATTNDPTYTVSGNLLIRSSATYTGSDLGSAALTVNGNLTVGQGTLGTFAVGAGSLNLLGNLSLATGSTFTKGGAVTFKRGDATPTITDSTAALQDLGDVHVSINASNNTSLTLATSAKMTSLTIDASQTFSMGASSFNLTISGDVANAGALCDGNSSCTGTGTGTVTVNGGDVTGNGTITLDGGTFLLDGASGTGFGGSGNYSFNNLTFGDGSGATSTLASGAGSVTVAGSMTIAANQTLDAGSKIWNLTGTGSSATVAHVKSAYGACVANSALGSPSNFVSGCNNVATDTFTYTANATGNGVLIYLTCGGATLPTNVTLAASGWTLTQVGAISGNSTGGWVSVFKAYAPNTSSATFTITWTVATGNCGGFMNDMIDEFSGVDATNFVDASIVTNGNGTSNSCNTLAVTPVASNDGLWFACDDTVSAVTGSYTEGNHDTQSDRTAWRILSGGAGVSQSPGYTASGAWSGAGVAIKASVTAPLTVTGVFTANASTINYSASSNTSLTILALTGANAYFNLTIAPTITGTTAYTFGSGTTTVGGSLLINPSATAQALTVTLGGTTVVTGSITIQRQSTATATLNTGSNQTLTAGSIVISAGGTLTPNSSAITDNGAFANNGTFTTPTGGSFTMATAAAGTITGGATTFNNFTVNAGVAKTITFIHGVIYTFAGTTTLTGTSTGVLTINSDDNTNQWLAHFNSAVSPVWVTVTHSGCDTGTSSATTDINSTLDGTDGNCWIAATPPDFGQLAYRLYDVPGAGANGGPVKIDDASNFGAMPLGARQVVRTSGGTLYAVLDKGTVLEVWSSSNGSSWTKQDTGTTVTVASGTEISAAIDGSNVIHMVYRTAAAVIKYRTFATGTNLFGTEETVGASNSTVGSLAVDSNNIPHVAYFNAAGSAINYKNRIGGAWGSIITVAPLTGSSVVVSDITIDEDNLPEVAWTEATANTVNVAVGNLNNATSFTANTVDATTVVTSGTGSASIAIDSSGNTWVTYVDADNSVDTFKRTDGSETSSWATGWTEFDSGVSGKEPSMAIDGTTVYVFYQDTGNDVAYNKYTGSWAGSTVLQTGTFQDIKAKWSFIANNQSSTQIDYVYSDAVDVYWASLSLGAAITDVGTPLAAQSTAFTLTSTGQIFRLRVNLHVTTNTAVLSGHTFKLQYALRSGTCDTAFSGESYADVTQATTGIAYYDNATGTDATALTTNANDPTSGNTLRRQTYEELNNFTNSQAAIAVNEDGMWDFSLRDNSGTGGDSYCIRIVKSTGTVLTSYTVVPEVTIFAAGVTLSGTSNGAGTVKFARNGTLNGGSAAISGGTWSISAVSGMAINDILTFWIDNVADSSESTAVAKYDGAGNMTGIILNTNVLSIGSIDDQSLTLANLDLYDCASDEDVMYRVNTNVLEVEGQSTCQGSVSNSYVNETIQVESGDTLTIGTAETLTTDNTTINGTLTGTGNAIFNITGSWDNNSVFNKGTSTTNFTSGGSETIDSTGSSTSDFYTVVMNGSGGQWTLNSAAVVGNTLNVTAGTLTTGAYAFTVSGTTTIDGGTLTLDNNTGTKLLSGAVSVSSGTLSGASTGIEMRNGITQSSSGIVSITGTTSFTTTASQSLSGTLSFGPITVGSGVTLTNNNATTTSGTITLTGNWTQANGSTLTTSAATTFGGAGALSASTATNTVNYSGGAQSVLDPTGGTAHKYYSLTLSGSGAKTLPAGMTDVLGNLSLSGTATATTTGALTVGGTTFVHDGTTFSLGNFTTTITGTTTVGDGASGILNVAGAGSTGTYTFTGAVSVAAGGSFDLNTGTHQTSFGAGITNSSNTSNSFRTGTGAAALVGNLAGAGTGGINFGGALTISSGTTTNSNTNTVTVGGILTLTGGWTQGTNSTLSYGSATILGNNGAGTFDASTNANTVSYTAVAPNCKVVAYSTLNFSGSGAVVCAVVTAANINLSGAVTWATTSSITVSGTLAVGNGTSMTNANGPYTLTSPTITITSNGTLTNNSITTVSTSLGGTGGFINGATGTLNIGFAGGPSITTLTATASGNTVNYTAATPTCKNVIYDNLTFSGASGAITCAISSGTSTNPTGTVSITSGETWTTSFSSAGAITLSGTAQMTTGVGVAVSGTITVGSGTAFINGNFTSSAGTVAVTSNGTFTNNGTMTISTALSGTGTFTNSASKTLNIGFAGPPTIAALDATGASNIVNYTAASPTCFVTTYVNLNFTGSGNVTCALSGSTVTNVATSGTVSWALNSTFVIGGTLTVGTGTAITTAVNAFTVTGATGVTGSLHLSGDTNNKTFTNLITVNNGGTLDGASATVVTSAGIANAGTVSLTGTDTMATAGAVFSGANPIAIATLTVNSPGTVSNTGTVTISGTFSGTGSWTQGSGATLNVAGGTTNAAAITTLDASSNANTVNYNGTTQTCKVVAYSTLLLSTSGTKTCAVTNISADVTMSGTASWTTSTGVAITGTLTVGTGTTFVNGAVTSSAGAVTVTSTGTATNNGTFTISGTFSGSGSWTQGSGSTLNAGGGTTNAVNVTTFDASTNANTVNYNGTTQTCKVVTYSSLTFSTSGTKTCATTSVTGNLVMSGTATWSTGANLVVTGSATVNNGATLTQGAFTLEVDGNTSIGSGVSGVFNCASSAGTLTLKGDLTLGSGSTWTKTNCGTLTFSKGAAQVITDNTATKQDLGAVATATASTSVSTATNTTLTTLNIAGSTTWDITGDTMTITGNSTPLTVGGTFTIPSSTVIYSHGTSATVTATTFNNLTLGVAAASATYILPNSTVTLRGNFLIPSGNTVTKGSGTLVFAIGGGNSQTITDNAATKNDLGAVQVSANSTNSTLNLATNTKLTTLTLDASQTFSTSTFTLEITGSGTALTIGGAATFTSTAGTVNYTYTKASSPLGVTIAATTYGNLGIGTNNDGTDAAITYSLGGNTITTGTLTIGNASSTNADVLSANNFDLTIGGATTITTKGTLQGSSGKNITIKGDWTNNGVYTHGSGTVVVDFSNISSVSGSISIAGSATPQTFNNITVTPASGRTLKFKSGSTFVFAGTVTLTGLPSNPLKLASTTPTSQWIGTLNGTSVLTYLTVIDSGCSGGSNWTVNDTVFNLGNNGVCWVFVSRGGGGVVGGGGNGGGSGGGGGTLPQAFTAGDGTALTTADSNWNNLGGTFAVNTNAVYSNVANTDTMARWTAGTFNDNQYSEITISASSTGYIGVGVRLQSGAQSGYGVYCNGTDLKLIEWSSGAQTTTHYTGSACSVSDVVRLEVSGTNLTVKKNGTTLTTVSDATYSTGRPGLVGRGNGSGTATTLGDNWYADNLGSQGGGGSDTGGGGGGTLPQAFTAGDGTALSTYDTSWTVQTGTFVINSNSVNTNTAGDNMARWTVGSFNDNQYSEITISALGTGYIGGGVRLQTGAQSGYGLYCNGTDSKIIKWTTGTPSTLYTGSACSGSDVIRLEVSGTTLTFKKNGTTVTTVSDSTYTTGRPGLVGNGSNATTKGDNFYADSLASQGGGGGGGGGSP